MHDVTEKSTDVVCVCVCVGGEGVHRVTYIAKHCAWKLGYFVSVINCLYR